MFDDVLPQQVLSKHSWCTQAGCHKKLKKRRRRIISFLRLLCILWPCFLWGYDTGLAVQPVFLTLRLEDIGLRSPEAEPAIDIDFGSLGDEIVQKSGRTHVD